MLRCSPTSSTAQSARSLSIDEPQPSIALLKSATRALAALDDSGRHGREGHRGAGLGVDAARLITERADLCGFPLGRSALSAGGGCRLVKTADGVIALSLTRVEDWGTIPALCGGAPIMPGDWPALVSNLGLRGSDEVAEIGASLGLAVSRADRRTPAPATPYAILSQGPAVRPPMTGPERRAAPLVLDMGALWAGPLCGHLLQRKGATVIKLEGRRRPDGARSGNRDFYALLNQHKACVAIDFEEPQDRALLLELIQRADIVIESARPRALRHIGISAEALVATRPGLVWIAISGYGRDEAEDNRIGYGDDAAAGAGLCAALHRATGRWAFVEDAIADPLTGIQAARAAWDAWRTGRGALIELSLRGVAAWSMAEEDALAGDGVYGALARWHRENSGGRRRPPLPPRSIEAPPAPLGADNGRVLDLIAGC